MRAGLAGLEASFLISRQRLQRGMSGRGKVTMSIGGRRMDWRGLVAGSISSWGAWYCLLLCGSCGNLRAFGACLLLSLWRSVGYVAIEKKRQARCALYDLKYHRFNTAWNKDLAYSLSKTTRFQRGLAYLSASKILHPTH